LRECFRPHTSSSRKMGYDIITIMVQEADFNNLFLPDPQMSWKNILKRRANNDNFSFLMQHLQKGNEGLLKIFEFGLNKIPTNFPEGGNDEMAEYFFLISELANIENEVRSFAVDVMEFCMG
jgi:hypothetical protein